MSFLNDILFKSEPELEYAADSINERNTRSNVRIVLNSIEAGRLDVCELFFQVMKKDVDRYAALYSPGFLQTQFKDLLGYPDHFKRTDEDIKQAVSAWCNSSRAGARSKEEVEEQYGHISDWDTSRVTNMNSLFLSKHSFNNVDNISSWNVTNVKSMRMIFYNARSFNQDISRWRVDAVEDMSGAFFNASSFNQDLSSWRVDSCLNMETMFYYAFSFNQNLSSWNVQSCENLMDIFHGASEFKKHQDVSTWGNWDGKEIVNIQRQVSERMILTNQNQERQNEENQENIDISIQLMNSEEADEENTENIENIEIETETEA